MESSFSAYDEVNVQDGFGRPENSIALAIHAEWSLELDVSMHDDHEAAEICVPAAIGCTWIDNDAPAVVKIGHRVATGLVCPVSVIAEPVAVKIPVRPDGDGDQIALVGTFEIG